MGSYTYLPLTLIDRRDGRVETAFSTQTGLSAQHIVHYTRDELYTADGEPLPDAGIDQTEDARALRQRIARAVRAGTLEGAAPDWQVILDDLEDMDLRALAADRIFVGANRDPEMGTWRLDCDALDTAATDPGVVREVIAGLIREGYT